MNGARKLSGMESGGSALSSVIALSFLVENLLATLRNFDLELDSSLVILVLIPRTLLHKKKAKVMLASI